MKPLLVIVAVLAACGGGPGPETGPGSVPPDAVPQAPSSATAADDRGRFTTEVFVHPLRIRVPDGWGTLETPASVSIFRGSGSEADLIGNRLLILSADDYGVVEADGAKPWPDDLFAWLEARPEFDPDHPRVITVVGTEGSLIDATAEWTPGPGQRDAQLLILPREIGRGGEEALHNGTFRWRFIEVEPGAGAGLVLVMWSPTEDFDAWMQAAWEVIESIELDR